MIHNSYTIIGITDSAVMADQAEKRRDRDGVATILHAHPYEDKDHREVPCDPFACKIFVGGHKTRVLIAEPELVEEK